MRQYHVYILASRSRRLYVGCTSDLARRVEQHRSRFFAGAHTARYRITRLVHFEVTRDARAAVARERQLKGWLRSRKVALIEASNPGWRDLAVGWGDLAAVPAPLPRTRGPALRSRDPSLRSR